MNYYNIIMFITLSTLVLMLGVISCNHNISKKKRNSFIAIYILIIVVSSCEWIGVCLDGICGNAVVLHKFVKFLEFLITPIFPVIYSKTIFSVSRKHSYWEIVFLMMLVFYSISDFISIHYEFIFYVDSEGYYHHAAFYNIYVFAFILSGIYFFKKMFEFSKYYQNRDVIVLLMIVVFIMIGVSIQFIVPSAKVTWLTIGISSIFIYFYYNQITMYVDYLTKLLNQRSYKTYLENVSFRVVILLFDIDNFKSINDNLGHVFGDTVLSIVGKTIKEVYSNYGYCYRIVGDEFCVILTKYDSVKELNDVFIDKLDKMRQSEPNLPYVSVGSAYFEPGYQDISDAIKSADENLYLQKSKLKSERESKT